MVTGANEEHKLPASESFAHPKFERCLWLAQYWHPMWRPGMRKLAVARHPEHQPRERCVVGVVICVN
jgi:hypothetical protein